MGIAASGRRLLALSILYAFVIVSWARPKHLPDPPTRDDRHSLIIAPASDGSMYSTWLEGSSEHGRNWDLVLLYYGHNPEFSCPECAAVWRGTGAKWNLIHRFVEENRNFTDRYCSVMMLDDDISISTTALNTYFEIFVDLNLTLAQPSLCPGSKSYWYDVVAQIPEDLLHFTSFVELMAPTASAAFFKDILAPTLNNSYTGWGLDFIWPFLAGLPHDKIGVIDAVCMNHLDGGGPKGRQRVYDAEGLPWTPEEEWDIQVRRHNMTKEAIEAAGLRWNTPRVFADVKMKGMEFVESTVESHAIRSFGGFYLAACIAALTVAALIVRRAVDRSGGMVRRGSESSLPLVVEKKLPRPPSRTVLCARQE